MAREKATITLDRSKADEARSLVGARSISAVIEQALDLLIRAERLRLDITAYRRVPPTETEIEIALLADTAGLADDPDWEAIYAEDAG
jgi:hypothetical protein